MNREKRIIHTVTDNLNDPLPGVPLVEVCGQRRVLIENHQGIAAYGCGEIQIKVRNGRIVVCGENLKLVKMSKEKLVITGRICAVNLQGRGKHGAI